MELRLGELLVEHGVLTADQVTRILSAQQESGEPFGLIAERLFGVDPTAVETAWAMQYARLTRKVNPVTEICDPEAIRLVTRRQAWQFRIMPVRFDPVELMIATTQQHLRRALRFATNVIHVPVFMVIAEPSLLGEALCNYYPLAGMTPRSVDDDGLDRLLELSSL